MVLRVTDVEINIGDQPPLHFSGSFCRKVGNFFSACLPMLRQNQQNVTHPTIFHYEIELYDNEVSDSEQFVIDDSFENETSATQCIIITQVAASVFLAISAGLLVYTGTYS